MRTTKLGGVTLVGLLALVGCGGGDRQPAAAPSPASGSQAVSPEGAVTVPAVSTDPELGSVVFEALAESLAEVRSESFARAEDGGAAVLAWESAGRSFRVLLYPGPDALVEAARAPGTTWGGLLYLADPSRSAQRDQELLEAARQAGARRIVYFQNASASVSDPAIYDLELEVQKGLLAAYGFSVEEMPALRADSAQAAQGDPEQKATFEELVRAIESHLGSP